MTYHVYVVISSEVISAYLLLKVFARTRTYKLAAGEFQETSARCRLSRTALELPLQHACRQTNKFSAVK
jgi:hypothetical protein